jgi:hypothetical protein
VSILRKTLRRHGIEVRPLLGAATRVGKGQTPDDAVKRIRDLGLSICRAAYLGSVISNLTVEQLDFSILNRSIESTLR